MGNKKQWASITREQLAKLYKTKNMPEIAAAYGVTTGAVAYRLRVFGLTAKHTGHKHLPGPKRRFLPPKEELERLYKSMSMREIAAHYGVGETVIFHRIRDYGIPVVSRSERMTGVPKNVGHRLSMSAVRIGTMLGEANPNWRGGKTKPARLARSKAAYYEWKHAVLAKAGFKCIRCGSEHGSLCDHCGHRILLHAHHVRAFADNPADRYNPENGEALCERCHYAEHQLKTG